MTHPENGLRPAGGSAVARTALSILVLVVGIYGIYGQTVDHGFVNWDDGEGVVGDPLVRQGWSADGLASVWTHVQLWSWQPLTTLSHMLDVELFGWNAGLHHLTSVLLHLATAVALLLVLERMTGAFWRSALVTLVFALHPLRVESVAWISERKDVLSGLLFVVTLGLWTVAVRSPEGSETVEPGRPRPIPFLASLVVFVLALLSKPMVVTLPCVLLLLDVWPFGRWSPGARGRWRSLGLLVVEKLPFFVLSGVVSAITLRTQEGAMTSAETLPLGARLGNALAAVGTYVEQLVLPRGLAVLYPHPGGGPAPAEIVLAGLIVLGATSLALWLALRRGRFAALVGWLWFLGMLVPVVGLVQVGVQAHADRYTYLPHVGLLIAVVWTLAEAWPGGRPARAAASVLAGLVVLALAVASWRQTGTWKDSETLWRRALATTSRNSIAHSQLGEALLEKGRTAEASAQLERAVRIQPDNATALYNLGNVLAGSGDLRGAVERYRAAIRARPGYGRAFNNLGAALLRLGRTGEAERALRRALEIDPRQPGARLNLAGALAARGDLEGALDALDHENGPGPEEIRLRTARASILLQAGRPDEAITEYREAVRLDPDAVDAHRGLGLASLARGALAEAVRHFRRALELEPGSARTSATLAMALERAGDRSGAASEYRRALGLAEAAGDATLARELRARLAGLEAEESARDDDAPDP